MASELQKIAFPEKYGPPTNSKEGGLSDKSPSIIPSRNISKSGAKVVQLFPVSGVDAGESRKLLRCLGKVREVINADQVPR
jgi:hypothetical protein